MFATSCYLIFSQSALVDFSYIKKPEVRNELAEAFVTIEKKKHYKKNRLATSSLEELADASYSAFLNSKNAYHVFLSYKIQKKESTPITPTNDDSITSKLLKYGADNNISYHDEITKILKEGNFEKHHEEESFLKDEVIHQDPEYQELLRQRLKDLKEDSKN